MDAGVKVILPCQGARLTNRKGTSIVTGAGRHDNSASTVIRRTHPIG